MANKLRDEVAALSAALAKARAALTQATQPTQGKFTARPANLPAHRGTLFAPATHAPLSKRDPTAMLGGSNTLFKGYPEFDPDQPRDKGGKFTGGGGGQAQEGEQPSGWRRAGRVAAQTAAVVALTPFTLPLMGLALRPAARAIYARRMAAERARRTAYRRLKRESLERAAREAAAARDARSLFRRGGLGRRIKEFMHGPQSGAGRTADAISRGQRAAAARTIDKLPPKAQERIRQATRRGAGDPSSLFAPWL